MYRNGYNDEADELLKIWKKIVLSLFMLNSTCRCLFYNFFFFLNNNWSFFFKQKFK